MPRSSINCLSVEGSMMIRLVLCFLWRTTWVLIHTMSSLAFFP
nr:hypothetical protein [uncultured Bifidobacterium sp.]